MGLSYREASYKIRQWLIEENDILKYKKIDDSDQSFNYQISLSEKPINIIMHNTHDRITLLSKMFLNQEQITAYSLLSTLNKKHICSDLLIILYQMGVHVQFSDPTKNQIVFINFQKIIYYDGFSKDRFFADINSILRGIDIAQEIFNYQISSDSNGGTTNSTSNNKKIV